MDAAPSPQPDECLGRGATRQCGGWWWTTPPTCVCETRSPASPRSFLRLNLRTPWLSSTLPCRPLYFMESESYRLSLGSGRAGVVMANLCQEIVHETQTAGLLDWGRGFCVGLDVFLIVFEFIVNQGFFPLQKFFLFYLPGKVNIFRLEGNDQKRKGQWRTHVKSRSSGARSRRRRNETASPTSAVGLPNPSASRHDVHGRRPLYRGPTPTLSACVGTSVKTTSFFLPLPGYDDHD